ncbi:uncharacterized protein LOC118433340 [Folsomia candida]|uniref:uncharacterized protein LOC118433340 n=1 Tax=Folsomia candida TaxID=158441 RepID=UPI0016053E05|nr:uncharacterized protein LOC118433340 [Folsomia candida]
MNLILKPIVIELNSLHINSTRLSFLSKTPFTHVQILQFCGDNLGLHTLFGFTESFNANFRCRFCKMGKQQTFTAIEEVIAQRRSLEDYENDLQINNVSLTGIREGTILNDIKGFHITSNFAPDIMHDVLEGICITELKLFLKHVCQNGFFSLTEINHRISSSIKSYSHSISKLPEIDIGFVEGDKKTCFSASEMSHFFLIFPAIFGDKLSNDDKHWILVLRLRRIIRILMAPQISRPGIKLLNYLISEHHETFINLAHSNLTPKFHHLLHYANAVEHLGPLKQYWCMRFEAKHRLAKTIGKNSYNFKNISKTIARRISLNIAFSLCEEVGSGINYKSGSRTMFNDLKVVFDFSKLSINPNDDVLIVDSLTINGTKVKSGNYFILNDSASELQFCQICLCLIYDEKAHVVGKLVKCEEYFFNSFLFKISDFGKPILIDPKTLELEYPLLVVNNLDDPHGDGLICCPIELV